MTRMNMLFGALFRPKATFARLAEGVKWAWVPALVVLLAASLANVVVSVPLQVKANIDFANAQTAGEDGGGRVVVGRGRTGVRVDAAEEEKAKAAEEAAKGPEGGGDIIGGPPADAEQQAIPLQMTAGLVFGAVGVIASLLMAALFFFVAGKVWAKRVTFTTYVSMVALAAMPLAARDILQTAYQAITGTWIQHQGISSFVAAKDAIVHGGLDYGLLSQIDVWAIWALALLYVGAKLSAGFEKKRALIAVGIFAVVTVLLRAAPAIMTGIFAGGGA